MILNYTNSILKVNISVFKPILTTVVATIHQNKFTIMFKKSSKIYTVFLNHKKIVS